MSPESQGVFEDGPAVDPRTYASAMLNILEDFSGERSRLDATQRAVLNILEDSAEEKTRLDDTQRAALNILEDAEDEKARLASAQRAVLNILEDFADERSRLDTTQRALLNILEDSDEEKARLADTQRAALNILDDFDIEKKKVERVNAELRNEISERTKAEEASRRAKTAAEAASKELEAFSYSVAHDLRAPLRSIDGFSQALLEDYADRLDMDGSRYLNHVREAAQQMGELIDDLLDLSRVTRADLRREKVDISKQVRSVIESLRELHPKRSLEVIVQDGLIGLADPRLLDVVLMNLLGNAWKFTSKRSSPVIEFAAKSESHPPIFFVRDNGAGFDARYQDKLFGVFQRLHSAQEFEGTGIGLATVRRIISRHGGRVWAEGEVDRGTTFYFTLEEEQS